MSYVPPELFEEWSQRDPIDLYAKRLVSDYGFSQDEVDAIRAEVHDYVAECAEEALASPMPDPADATDGVFADGGSRWATARRPWSRWQQADDHSQNGHSNGSNGDAS